MLSIALFSSLLVFVTAWDAKTVAPSGSPIELSTRGSFNPTGAPSGSPVEMSTRGSFNPTGAPASYAPSGAPASYAPSGAPGYTGNYNTGSYYTGGYNTGSGFTGGYTGSGFTGGYNTGSGFTGGYTGSGNTNAFTGSYTGRPSRPIVYPTNGFDFTGQPSGGPIYQTFSPLKPKIPTAIELAINRMKLAQAAH